MTDFEKLNEVFRVVFDDETIQISSEMKSKDIEGWDSLSHANLIAAVELKFGLSFTRKELFSFKTVGDIYNTIEAKLNM